MRFLRCLLGFLLGLVVTALVAYRLLPRLDRPIDEILAEAPRCQVLFVGPSYIEVGLDTALFDSKAQELGHPLRSCKFTRSALRAYELKHDLGQLMEHRWPALKYVAIDLSLPTNVAFERQNWFSPRMVHWHTWNALGWLGRHYRSKRLGWVEVAPLALAHVEHAAMNYLSIGRAGSLLTHARWVEGLTGRDQGITPPKEVDRLPRGPRRQDRTEEERAVAGRQVAQDKARDRTRRRYLDDDWPRELEPLIRAAGYRPIFLYSPVLGALAPPRPNRPGKKPLVFLDFDDPDRYPELYRGESRARTSHLSREGAKHYSRILAQTFVTLDSEREDADERREPRNKRERGKRDRGKRERDKP